MLIVVLVTAKDTVEAERITIQLTEKKLIACANIVSGVKSIFWWNNALDEAEEVLIIMKTHKKHFSNIVQTVKFLHSYETPEIIALPIADGSQDYLDWIEGAIR